MTNLGQKIEYNSKLARYPRPAIALTAITYVLLGLLEALPGTVIPPLLYFFADYLMAASRFEITAKIFDCCP
jgi:hypothetical protein